jgi:hypothetical protein
MHSGRPARILSSTRDGAGDADRPSTAGCIQPVAMAGAVRDEVDGAGRDEGAEDAGGVPIGEELYGRGWGLTGYILTKRFFRGA